MLRNNKVIREIEISEFQKRVLKIPEYISLFLGGGRGGAKTYLVAIIALKHILKYKEKAKILYIRNYVKSLKQFQGIFSNLLDSIGNIPNFENPDKPIKMYSFNDQDHIYKFFNGAILQMTQMANDEDYNKHHGKDYTLMIVDELTLFSEEQITNLIDTLRTCVRASAGIITRLIYLANPGGVGHSLVKKRYIDGRTPWEYYEDPAKPSKETLAAYGKTVSDVKIRQWVSCPSTYMDNPFIDGRSYVADLLAKNEADPDTVRAWVSGDWEINRGTFFDSEILDPILGGRNRLYDWPCPSQEGGKGEWRNNFNWMPGMDYGPSAPTVVHIAAISKGGLGPDGMYYAPGSVIIVDEWSTHIESSYDTGRRMDIEGLAKGVKDLCAKWNIPPTGPADDAIFNNDGRSKVFTIAGEFKQHGVFWFKAEKGSRMAGITLMKEYMRAAGTNILPGGKNNTILDYTARRPGLYVCDRCKYFWATVPKLQHNPRNMGDYIEKADHSADCVRYIITYSGPSTKQGGRITTSEFDLWG